MADLNLLQQEYEDRRAERDALHQDLKDINLRLSLNKDALAKLKSQITAMQMASRLSNSQPDWAQLIEYDWPKESNYKKFREAVKELFPEGGITGEGYWPDTNQNSVRIRMDENTPALIDGMTKFLETLLPLIKPRVIDRHGDLGKMIKIMEPSLSEHGSYYLHAYDDRLELSCFSYRKNVLATFKDVKAALEYIQQHLAFTEDD